MALHQKNLWTTNSHAGSSSDTFDPLGGLAAGTIRLPSEFYSDAKGIRVWTTKNPTSPESYTTHNSFTSAIGGKHVVSCCGDTLIEFDTNSSSSGYRGIYKIDGAFEARKSPNDLVTQSFLFEAIQTHRLDRYKWEGTHTIRQESPKNLFELDGGFTAEINEGDTYIDENSRAMVVNPPSDRTRAILVTVKLSGTTQQNDGDDINLVIKLTNGTIVQEHHLFLPNERFTNSTYTFVLYTWGKDDPFSNGGFKIEAAPAPFQGSVTLTKVVIIAHTLANPEIPA